MVASLLALAIVFLFILIKKKSLILLHEVLDGELLEKIKHMKILQTLQTFHLRQGIVEEKTLEGHSSCINCLVDPI